MPCPPFSRTTRVVARSRPVRVGWASHDPRVSVTGCLLSTQPIVAALVELLHLRLLVKDMALVVGL